MYFIQTFHILSLSNLFSRKFEPIKQINTPTGMNIYIDLLSTNNPSERPVNTVDFQLQCLAILIRDIAKISTNTDDKDSVRKAPEYQTLGG